jgi:glycosyltransferase involved in cell wall biosynthesis
MLEAFPSSINASGQVRVLNKRYCEVGPTRVLFVNHTAQSGGGELALRLLIRHLDKTLVEHQLLLFEDGPIAESLRADTSIHIFPLSDEIRNARKDTLGAIKLSTLRKFASLPLFVLRLSRMIRNLNVDVVHTNSLKADVLGGIAARLAGKRVVWHVRDRVAEDYLPSRTVHAFRRLARLIPHAIIANSHATLETLGLPENEHGHRANRCPATVVHDGFDFAELPEQENSPGAGPLVGFIGRISPWKGQDVFLRAIHLIHSEFPLAHFQIIGSALFGEEAYADHIRRLCTELGLDQRVEFCGFIRDVQRHIAKLDVVVHASTIPEPFGQVIIEGMAAGKPVIASRGGGATEIVVDGVSGLLVPMKDPGALAAAMRKLLRDADLRARLGAAGYARVHDAFNIEATAAKVSQVYSELCAR